MGQWAALSDHGLIGDESARGQYDPATRSHGAKPLGALYPNANDRTLVEDQCIGPGVGHHSGAAARHGGTEAFHEEPAGGVDVLGFVTALGGERDLVKGVRIFAPAKK